MLRYYIRKGYFGWFLETFKQRLSHMQRAQLCHLKFLFFLVKRVFVEHNELRRGKFQDQMAAGQTIGCVISQLQVRWLKDKELQSFRASEPMI